jgi:hypothetical protein
VLPRGTDRYTGVWKRVLDGEVSELEEIEPMYIFWTSQQKWLPVDRRA